VQTIHRYSLNTLRRSIALGCVGFINDTGDKRLSVVRNIIMACGRSVPTYWQKRPSVHNTL